MKTLKQIAKEEGLNKKQFEMLEDIVSYLWLDDSSYLDEQFEKYAKKIWGWKEDFIVKYVNKNGKEKVWKENIIDLLNRIGPDFIEGAFQTFLDKSENLIYWENNYFSLQDVKDAIKQKKKQRTKNKIT